MTQTSTLERMEHQTQGQPRRQSLVRRFVTAFVSTLVWSFLLALVIGSSVAAVWTVMPTELLDWGSSKVNLIGYVSHCSFTPLSTTILVVAALVGVLLIWKLDLRNDIGLAMSVGMILGGAISVTRNIGGEIFLSSLIGMGMGIGIGVALGIIIGVVRQEGH